MKIQQI